MMSNHSETAPARRLMHDTLKMTALAAVLGAAIGLAPLGLGQAHGADNAHLTITGKSFGSGHDVKLGLNKSLIVDLPVDAKEVIVSQPGIASAVMRSKRRAILQGVTAGSTNILFLDGVGRQIAVLDINVGEGPTGGPQQVMLKVTVAEVQRSIAKQLGINLSGNFSVGALTGSFNGGAMDAMTSVPTGGGDASFPIPFGNTSLDVELRALETRGALRTLAEPVLTAMSGQPASFLAGGEIPYPTTDDNGNRIVDFKPYGVQLDFTPTITSSGTIQLVVDSTVSEPATEGALNTRRVSTTVELGAGQTLSIAGLLSERQRQNIARLPGLGDIPILGALFRSREYTSDRTELVFLVTPYYARAKTEAPILPTDDLKFAGDAEAIFLGHIETIYGVGPDGMRGSYNGSVGFLLD